MSYVDPDYETKKEFKAAVATGAKHRTYSPGPLGDMRMRTISDELLLSDLDDDFDFPLNELPEWDPSDYIMDDLFYDDKLEGDD